MRRLLGHAVLLGRGVRIVGRQPVAIAVMIIQPLVWLLLYSQLFQSLPRLGGFETANYLEYLAPGIAIFAAFNHGAWEGGGVVQDIERGAIDRFLTTSLPAAALLSSRTLQAALIGAGQALFVMITALVFGARVRTGPIGFLIILIAGVLVCTAFAAFTHTIALLARRQETMTMVGLFITFPLMFSSTMFTSAEQMPSWLQHLASLNPVNWAVEAARAAMLGTNWTTAAVHLVALAGFATALSALSRLALRRYRLQL
ncbi:ABC transporter permease [Microlunatus soli]|uniref:Transport permease protein n=1 Tax=Microlunatus soli TaxID=630515 RepID=A0A1H1SU67_9ACTN|nr:ABC transporter permease [Microlunatus soli]SDS50949.1 ABC-2 type transport system permease protein [Microlunatus soli]